MPIALPVSSPVANGKGSTSLICEIGIFGIERRIYRKGATDVRSGRTSRASLRFKVPTPLKERSTNRQALQTPTFVGIGQVRTALSSMQPGQTRFLESQVECNRTL